MTSATEIHAKEGNLSDETHIFCTLGMESKSGENFLSLQCKYKGEGGGLRILLVKIAIHK